MAFVLTRNIPMVNTQLRFALFVPSLRGGGAERTTLKLAQGLVQCGYAVDLVLAQAEGPYLAEVPAAVRVVDLKASRIMIALPALVRYLRREPPAAMLSVMNHTNIIALWARRLAGVPTRIVISERSALAPAVRRPSRWQAWVLPPLMKRYYYWADAIVAVSQGVAADLTEVIGLPSDGIDVIYNPVVTPTLHQQAQAALDHPWFQLNQPPVVLAVGRLEPQKDFPTLIRAFAQVRRTQAARLLILGEGAERSSLEALIQALDLEQDVSLPGFVSNPHAYMSRAALFVLPSRWEGLPGVLIEALYCGTPLIATDCPGGSREVLKDGQYGQLVPVGEVAPLAEAMLTALAGNSPSPPAESWHPFEQTVVVEQYLNILMGHRDLDGTS